MSIHGQRLSAGARWMGLLAVGPLLVVPQEWSLGLGVPPTGLSQPPQYLPVKAQWCLSGPAGAPASNGSPAKPAAVQAAGPCLALEVPKTERQYAWGLQMRPPLPPMHGMWFAFQPPSPARFWMHRTLAPLDMVFVRGGVVASIEPAAPPCPRLPCPSYGSGDLVDGVVELRAGEAARLGIRVGTPVEIRTLP
jgi:uncharacterized membrane protein (UPF0127 family)